MIRLDANESFIALPEPLRAQIAGVIAGSEWNRYPDPAAARLCESFAGICGVPAECVVAGNGSDELISILFLGFLQKGDGVLLLEPDFSMYRFYAELNELNVYAIKKADDFSFDIAAIADILSRGDVKLLIFSNPCNPTGRAIPRADALQLAEAAERGGALIAVDEAYMEFWELRQSLLGDIARFENLIVFKTLSKAYGLAALRCGFAVASPRTAQIFRRAKSPYNVNALTQAAALCVIGNRAMVEENVKAIKSQKAKLCNILNNYSRWLDQYETVTNFALCRVPDAAPVTQFLMDSGIAVRVIGNELLRITAGSDEEQAALFAAIDRYYAGGRI